MNKQFQKIRVLKVIRCAFLCATFCLSAFVAKSQTTYDVFTYTEPKGYKKETKTDFVSYTKSDSKTGTYCIISLYKQSPSSGDLVKDFDNDWQELVVPIGVTATPQKDNGDEITGWKTYTGAANFELGGGTSMAILTTAKKDNINAAILVVTNAQSFLTTDVDVFFDKLKLGKPMPVQLPATNTPSTANTPNTSNSKIDLWMFLSLVGVSAMDYQMGVAKPDFYAVFSNGDYYPHYPWEGMGNLNNTNKQSDSWGKYSLLGNKVSFKSKYEDLKLDKVTATQYKQAGSAMKYYKCARVEGLKLIGGWTNDKNWRENRYNQGDCRPVIYFGTDGSFIDRGAFLRACGSPSTDPKDQAGEGTYSINNFTLTLKYNDGRTVTKAFTGNLDKNPTTDNTLLYIGNNPFYKDK